MSKIEWTDKTWNPTLGCREVSPGCEHCYAARMAHRLGYNPATAKDYQGLTEKLANGKIVWTGKVNILEDRLLEPARRQKPTRYFVDSMSDLFHPDIPFAFIAKVYAAMALAPQHTFQVLTKRPDRAREFYDWLNDGGVPCARRFDQEAEQLACNTPDLFFEKDYYIGEDGKKDFMIGSQLLDSLKTAGWGWDVTYTEWGKDCDLIYDGPWPLPNVWVGTSVENQKTANERIPILLTIPAAIRFLSCEPLLGRVSVEACPIPRVTRKRPDGTISLTHMGYIDWVIVGGESGPGARPMHLSWARTLRDECQEAGVPFFFKQMGEWGIKSFYDPGGIWLWEDGTRTDVEPRQMQCFGHVVVSYEWLGKKAAGRLLDGVQHNEFPDPKSFA